MEIKNKTKWNQSAILSIVGVVIDQQCNQRKLATNFRFKFYKIFPQLALINTSDFETGRISSDLGANSNTRPWLAKKKKIKTCLCVKRKTENAIYIMSEIAR